MPNSSHVNDAAQKLLWLSKTQYLSVESANTERCTNAKLIHATQSSKNLWPNLFINKHMEVSTNQKSAHIALRLASPTPAPTTSIRWLWPRFPANLQQAAGQVGAPRAIPSHPTTCPSSFYPSSCKVFSPFLQFSKERTNCLVVKKEKDNGIPFTLKRRFRRLFNSLCTRLPAV